MHETFMAVIGLSVLGGALSMVGCALAYGREIQRRLR